ncbi:hypothetical protein ABLE91_23105 [Aquabacter sp. CN5-332]|uniref:hypothetical protein n=1 Tax=Aquabacter sp. CN5-332 TaxID=3156608 RepID=UPI0032B44645
MNRIVREHYPVEKLPDDLRESVADKERVRVVLETEAPEGAPPSGDSGAGHFSRWQHLRRDHFDTPQDIVDHIRALRDEWDRR